MSPSPTAQTDLLSASTKLVTRFAIAIAAVMNIAVSSVTHRAHLTTDLLAHEARHTSARVGVVVHGTPAEAAAIAARHNLRLIRQSGDKAVLSVNSSELSDLAGDFAIDRVAADLPLRAAGVVAAR